MSNTCAHKHMIPYILTDVLRTRICVDCWEYVLYALSPAAIADDVAVTPTDSSDQQ